MRMSTSTMMMTLMVMISASFLPTLLSFWDNSFSYWISGYVMFPLPLSCWACFILSWSMLLFSFSSWSLIANWLAMVYLVMTVKDSSLLTLRSCLAYLFFSWRIFRKRKSRMSRMILTILPALVPMRLALPALAMEELWVMLPVPWMADDTQVRSMTRVRDDRRSSQKKKEKE